MNLLGLLATILGIAAFYFAHRNCRGRALRVRVAAFLSLVVLAIPAMLSAIYYLHVLPEWAWFYQLRSYPGSELLVIFLGAAAGAAAALLPRPLLSLPLGAAIVLSIVPYIKPLIAPFPDSYFQERWVGDACIQSTPGTCGPASTATILRAFGLQAGEREIARAAFNYSRGTEAWYLARYVRRRGLAARFIFTKGFSPAAGQPALVGVNLDGIGHFIAVLEVSGGDVRFADPLGAEQRLPLAQFQRRYDFTGFHMVVTKP